MPEWGQQQNKKGSGRGRQRHERREKRFACSEGSVANLLEGLSLFSLPKLGRISWVCSVHACVCTHVPVCLRRVSAGCKQWLVVLVT